MARLLGILGILGFAAAVVVLTWPQLFHLERSFPIAQVIAFRGLVVFALGAIAVLALLLALLRPFRAFMTGIALVALVAVIANGVVLGSRGLGGNTLPAKDADSLRVLTWNTAGATDPTLVAQTAVAMEADVVALPETTIATGEAIAVSMRDLGRPMWAYDADFGEWDADSTTLLISPDLGEYSVIQSSLDGSSNTSTVPSAVAMPVDGDGPTIVAAHAVAPRTEDMAGWRSDLQWLADQCSVDNVILAGDFNATLDQMGSLGVDGGTLGRCRDAASQTGNGAVGTWTTTWPALLGAPIDHVMATVSWQPTGSAVLGSFDGSGSDHRPLVVQYRRVA